MKSIEILLKYGLFLSFFVVLSCKAEPKEGFEVTFPFNEYLTTSPSSPYPSVVQEKVNSLKSGTYLNVLNFGAKGDGLTVDDAAIAAAFAACKKGTGVLFPAGKTFLIKNLIQVPIRNDITVIAEGATFKMADNTGYNAIALESQGEGYNNNIIWIGGTWDGNKDRQAWPGSPTKNNKWTVTQGNYGLLTIKAAKFAMVKNVHLINTVYDGVDLYECKLGVIADSKAEGGAPLNYKYILEKYGQGHQSTYFKVTRKETEAAYFINLNCSQGSIGVQYSTVGISENSLAVVSNCQFYNQAQDAMHFEDCRRIFVYKCNLKADKAVLYHEDIHLSNQTLVASIKESQFFNAKVDFRNASRLQIGVVENCTFNSDLNNSEDSTNIDFFIHNATHVSKCKLKGKTPKQQVSAKFISESTFEDFNIATMGIAVAENCSFKNGKYAIVSPKSNPVIDKCIFNNLDNSSRSLVGKSNKKGPSKQLKVINSQNEVSKNSQSSDNSWRKSLKKSIIVVNQNNKVIGNVSE